jgi:hypothetical protein
MMLNMIIILNTSKEPNPKITGFSVLSLLDRETLSQFPAADSKSMCVTTLSTRKNPSSSAMRLLLHASLL